MSELARVVAVQYNPCRMLVSGRWKLCACKKSIRKAERSRMLQRTFELHTPFLVDSVIRRDAVLTDSPDHELLLEASSKPDLFTRSADDFLGLRSAEFSGGHQLERRFHQYLTFNIPIGMTHICSYNGGTPRYPLVAMYQNRASFSDGLVNEVARGGEMNKKIRVVDVFDRDPQLPDPASRDISWDRIRADGYDMSDPSLRYSSGSASSDQAIRETNEAC